MCGICECKRCDGAVISVYRQGGSLKGSIDKGLFKYHTNALLDCERPLQMTTQASFRGEISCYMSSCSVHFV